MPPRISQEQAEKILTDNGYTVLGYLGNGAASYAFKASRESKKPGKEDVVVAAKVCCPDSGSWASLSDELRAADELKNLKKNSAA